MNRLKLALAASLIALGGATAMAQQTTLPNTPAFAQSGASAAPHADHRADHRADREARRAERMQRREERMRERGAQMEERMNRRLERLKADLALSAQQQPLWDRVEAQIKKNMAERRESGRAAMERMRSAELPARLDMMAERASQNATRAREMADVVKPLWETLSGSQKALVRHVLPGGRKGEGHGRGEERGHGRKMHHGSHRT